MLEDINNINNPDLNPENLVWLTEMGINYGLLKTFQPQINKNIKTVDSSKLKTVVIDKDSNAAAVDNKAYYQSPKQKGSLAKEVLNNTYDQEQTELNKTKIPIQTEVEKIDTNDLLTLQQMAESCTKCDLHQQRDKMVFGFGHEQNPDLMIIGQAPGRSDDASGYPFQGKPGKLLHFMLLSIGIYPDKVSLGSKPQPIPKHNKPLDMYFANLVKCRPVGNRSPSESEIKQCYPYLKAQIALIKPKCILVMGSLAAKYLLNQNQPLEQLRSKVHYIDVDESKVPVVATWHPTSLLLQPQNKPLAWADLQLLRSLI